MRALILNAANRLGDLAGRVRSALETQLTARGYQVTNRDLVGLSIPDCLGDFGCWVVTPGICVHQGPHREIAREVIGSDLILLLSPLTFGGYSSAAKKALDHLIPLISPFFSTVGGETHHIPRYPRFPDLLAVGLTEGPDPQGTRVFERLVTRNALNMHALRFASPVLARTEAADLDAKVLGWLAELAAARPAAPGGESLDLSAEATLPVVALRRALLLLGSPRAARSTSASLAEHLAASLSARGVSVTTERLHALLRADPELRGLCASLPEYDLVVFASPLYVDSLPGPVTEALELLWAGRAAAPAARRPRLLAVVNCGFPEAVHGDTALAIYRRFAIESGLDWVGGLAVGGGGMIDGRPLQELGGRARALTRALSLTADAVAGGGIVPAEAERLARQRAVPAWLYRFFADWGFKKAAGKRGTSARLMERPHPLADGSR